MIGRWKASETEFPFKVLHQCESLKKATILNGIICSTMFMIAYPTVTAITRSNVSGMYVHCWFIYDIVIYLLVYLGHCNIFVGLFTTSLYICWFIYDIVIYLLVYLRHCYIFVGLFTTL